jgi:serralysin
VFADLVPGSLSAAAFRAGAAATEASHRILYDTASGLVSYDPDGSGGQAAIAFARLGAGLALTAASFEVI